MLADVVSAVRSAGHDPEILATEPLETSPAPVSVDDRSLSEAVTASLDPPDAVVMGDMPLLTPGAIERAVTTSGDVVIGPGRSGGTNLLVVRSGPFHVDYHGISLRDHRQIAAANNLSLAEVDSHRISTDIDEPGDLIEVLLHSDGAAATWLREHGFSIVAESGKVGLERESRASGQAF